MVTLKNFMKYSGMILIIRQSMKPKWDFVLCFLVIVMELLCKNEIKEEFIIPFTNEERW